MPDRVEALVLAMNADIRRMERALNQARGQTNRQLSEVEKRFDRMNQHVRRSGDRMASDLRAGIAAIAIGAVTKGVVDYADAWTEAGNKIAAAGVQHDQVAGTLARLSDLAKETRSDFSATVDLYSRVTRSTKELKVSQEDLFRVVETANKAFKAGGASLGEQQSAILQLGQALGSGTLAGDELRAIRENAPLLAKAIADEFGVTLAGLKKLGEQGKLSSERVFKAILNAGADIEKQFAATQSTVKDAFTNLTTAAIRYVGEADKASGATKDLSGFIQAVADDFDKFASAAIVAAQVLGGVLAGQAVLSLLIGLTRLTVGLQGAAAGMALLRTAGAFFLGPWGAAILAIGAAVVAFSLDLQKAEKQIRSTDQAAKDMLAVLSETDDLFNADSPKRFADQLSAVEKEADFAKRRIGELNAEMEKSGELAKQSAISRQWEENFRLINDIAAKQDELARLQAPKRFRDRPIPGTTIGSKEDIAAYSASLVRLNELLAVGQQRLADLQKRARGDFKPDDGSRGGGATGLTEADAEKLAGGVPALQRAFEENDKKLVEAIAAAEKANRQDLVDQLNLDRLLLLAEFDQAKEDLETVKLDPVEPIDEMPDFEFELTELQKNIRDSVKNGLRMGLVDDDWGTALRNILADGITSAMDDALNRMADALTKWLFQSGEGGAGDLLSSIGSAIFGGGRATGGPTLANHAYKINETGEGEFLWTGRNGQMITPAQLAGMLGAASQGGGSYVDARTYIGGVDMVTFPVLQQAMAAQTRAIASRLPGAVNATLIDNRRQKRRL